MLLHHLAIHFLCQRTNVGQSIVNMIFPTADIEDVMFNLACDESIITEYPLIEDGCLNDVLNTGVPDCHGTRYCCEI